MLVIGALAVARIVAGHPRSRPARGANRSHATEALPPLPGTLPAKWRTVFEDDFAGRSLGPSWITYTGKSFATSTNRRRDVGVDGRGQLVLTARRAASGWQSAEVATRETFAPRPGQTMVIEAELSLPTGKGVWPAFWADAAPARNDPALEPAAGEADIAETIDTAAWVAQYLHCGPSRNRGPCANNAPTSHLTARSSDSWKRGYHTYAFVWHDAGTHSYVAFYIDKRLELEVTEAQVGARYWQDAFDHPYFILFDVETGGAFPGPPGPTSPARFAMRVDVVRVLES